MKRRLIRMALWLTVLLVLVIPAGLGFLVGSETGSRWLIGLAAGQVPGELEIGQVDGTLLRGITLTETRYRHQRIDFHGRRLSLAVNPLALLQGSLRIITLDGETLKLEIGNADASQPTGDGLAGLPDINLPMHISMPGAELRDVTLIINGESRVLESMSLAGHAADNRISLQHFRVTSGDYRLSLGGELVMTMPWQVDAWLDWQAPLPAAVADRLAANTGQGSARLRGDLTDLAIEHRLREPTVIDSEGRLALLDVPVSFNLSHRWPAVTLSLPGERRLQLDDGHLQTGGSTAAYQLELHRMTARLADLPPLEISLRGAGDRNRLDIEQAGIHGEQGHVELDGGVAWSPALEWHADLTAQHLNPSWLALVVRELGMDTPPDREGSRARLLEHLAGLPPLNIQLRARGDGERLTLDEARIDDGPRQLRLKGNLAWSPSIQWQAEIHAREFDPALLHPEAYGRISLEAQSNGNLADPDHPDLSLTVHQLSGELRDQPVTGRGHARLRGQDHLDADLNLQLADTRVHLQGQWSEQPDLRLTVSSGQLALLWPQLGGRLNLNAHLHGTRDALLINASGQGTDLVLGDYHMDDVDLRIDAANQPLPGMNMALSAGALTRAETLLFSGLTLSGSGRLAEHQLQWQVSHGSEQLHGRLTGEYEAEQWLANLQAMSVEGPLSGNWQLEAPAVIRVAPGDSRLSSLCLLETDREARLCGDLLVRGENEQVANLQLADVPLAPLSAFLPTPARIHGRLNAEARFRRDATGVNGMLTLDAGSGHAELDQGDEDYRIPWQVIRGEVRLDQQQLNAVGLIELDAHSSTEGRLEVQLDGADSRLDGRISSRLDDLRWLELLVPRLRNPQGAIRGDLAIGGRFNDPTFGGQISLTDGAAEVPELGIELKNIGLRAHGDAGGRLLIEGGLASGNGQLDINGELDTRGALPWPVTLDIRGEKVLVVQRPDARILLNPELDLTLDGTLLTVRGNVLIPEARLSPRQLPRQAVSVSRDARVLGRGQQEQQRSPWQVDTDVRVSLGDEVTIDGFGLQARLTGAVRIEDRPRRATRLTGEVRIQDGRYRAYGQNLRVERGRLLFEGPPDNPGLDIVAVRVIPAHQVRAGLEIGGTLRDPRSQVFSEPAMEDSQAMAWLLTGRPLSGASEAEGAAILEAITLYGIKQGEFITDSVGDTLGLEVGVDTEGESGNAALMLGRQLSSRLYLRYSVGLFESLSSVMLRYTLNRNLSLETRSSGEAQSVDLIYRLER